MVILNSGVGELPCVCPALSRGTSAGVPAAAGPSPTAQIPACRHAAGHRRKRKGSIFVERVRNSGTPNEQGKSNISNGVERVYHSLRPYGGTACFLAPQRKHVAIFKRVIKAKLPGLAGAQKAHRDMNIALPRLY